MPGKRTVELTEHDAGEQRVTFTSTVTFDAAAPDGPEARALDIAKRSSLRTSATYSLSDGFPTRVEVVSQNGNDGDQTVLRETYEWLRVE